MQRSEEGNHKNEGNSFTHIVIVGRSLDFKKGHKNLS
jgi:hypothetical protein